jgi:hypothetical protein
MQTWMPAIHAGMTNAAFSSSVGERKLKNHSVVHIRNPYSVAGTGCGAGACSGSRQREIRSIA